MMGVFRVPNAKRGRRGVRGRCGTGASLTAGGEVAVDQFIAVQVLVTPPMTQKPCVVDVESGSYVFFVGDKPV